MSNFSINSIMDSTTESEKIKLRSKRRAGKPHESEE
jgi:hypothetical protein